MWLSPEISRSCMARSLGAGSRLDGGEIVDPEATDGVEVHRTRAHRGDQVHERPQLEGVAGLGERLAELHPAVGIRHVLKEIDRMRELVALELEVGERLEVVVRA